MSLGEDVVKRMSLGEDVVKRVSLGVEVVKRMSLGEDALRRVEEQVANWHMYFHCIIPGTCTSIVSYLAHVLPLYHTWHMYFHCIIPGTCTSTGSLIVPFWVSPQRAACTL